MLRDLRFCNAAIKLNPIETNFPKLDRLQYSDLNTDCNHNLQISELIAKNRSTIRHLELGFERYIAMNTFYLVNGRRYDLSRAQEKFWEVFQERESWLYLNSLRLMFFNFSKKSFLAFDFQNLVSLRLESCIRDSEILSFLTVSNSTSNMTKMSKLTSFYLRHESLNTAFHANLKAFLLSFSGLKHLSLLLQGIDPVASITPFLKNHGATLESLVWDQQFKQRLCAAIRTDVMKDRPSYKYKEEIAMVCPNLRELGLVSEISCEDRYEASRAFNDCYP